MKNTSHADAIAKRRDRVAFYRLRGLSQRAIAEALAAEEIVNPKTGEPYNVATINSDLRTLREDWQKAALATTDQQRGQLLAELREARRAAWDGAGNAATVKALLTALETDDEADVRAEAAKALGRVGMPDLRSVLQALAQEAKLLGLDAPTRVAVNWEQEAQAAGVEPQTLLEALADAFVAALASGAQAIAAGGLGAGAGAAAEGLVIEGSGRLLADH